MQLLKATPLEGMRLSAITNHECEQAKFPGDAYTANAALRTLRRILSKAKETKHLFGELPKIKMRKVWGRSEKMTNADCAAIAARLKGDPKDALLILRSTGMRPKECYAMAWEDVDFETGRYQIPKGKTKSAKREIPLLGDSLSILKRRWLEQGQPRQGFVFPSGSKSGHILNIHKAFIAARRAAGLPDSLVLYCARHGAMSDFATVLPLAATMQIGGHSDARTAMGYQHHEITDLQARLDEAKTNGRIN